MVFQIFHKIFDWDTWLLHLFLYYRAYQDFDDFEQTLRRLSDASANVGLLASGHDASLTLVGSVFDGNQEYADELTALAEVHDVLDRVRFAGFQDDIRPILAATDIAIVPSRIEPFGTVAAESMAAGVLTVVAAVQGLTEIVESGRNGLTFPSGDHAALARQCAWAADNPAPAAELARQGQCDVDERFGLDTYQRQIVELIESVDVRESAK